MCLMKFIGNIISKAIKMLHFFVIRMFFLPFIMCPFRPIGIRSNAFRHFFKEPFDLALNDDF